MTTVDPTTTPEPGQRVLIEAIVKRIKRGEAWANLVAISTGEADTDDDTDFPLYAVRWHTADVPPQSLGHGTIADAFAGLDAMSEALRMAASPPQATVSHETQPDAADDASDTPGASQGAGRDWRREIVDLIDMVLAERNQFDEPRHYLTWGHFADEHVAALGLHNLEQTTAKEARLRRSETAEADKLAADLRAERDAARRELQQLRDDCDVYRQREAQLRDEIRCIAGSAPPTGVYLELIAALAGRYTHTGPATHNNQENQ